MQRRNWTRDELILAFNLYLKLSFGQMHHRNPDIQHLAKLIGRNANAVAMRLSNFASVDPYHQQRGIKGLEGGKKQVQPIWDEFVKNREELIYESEKIRAKFEKKPLSEIVDLRDIEIQEGKEVERLVKTRVNQNVFRDIILATYNNKCCITGIATTSLLVASHILPWAKDKGNRLNPSNGLCLNALHDRAFDNYLITISPKYKVQISKRLAAQKENKAVVDNFLIYDGAEIALPERYMPEPKFLKQHNTLFAERNK
jgi:putative restriction endonuclease